MTTLPRAWPDPAAAIAAAGFRERVRGADNGTPDELKSRFSDGHVMVVEAANLTDAALTTLREIYPNVKATSNGVEITAEAVSLYDIEDVLRPRGIVVQSTYYKQVTLDDVFLELTGKQLRE